MLRFLYEPKMLTLFNVILNNVEVAESPKYNYLEKIIENAIGYFFSILMTLLLFVVKIMWNRHIANRSFKQELKLVKDMLKTSREILISKDNYLFNPIKVVCWETYKNDGFMGLSKNKKIKYMSIYNKISDLNFLCNKKGELQCANYANNQLLIESINTTIDNLIALILEDISKIFKEVK